MSARALSANQTAIKTAWRRQMEFMAAAAAWLVVLIIVISTGYRVEGYFAPIVQASQLVAQKQMEDGTIQFRFSYDKLRACNPLGVEWYADTGEGYFEPATVAQAERERLRNRPTGRQYSDWWVAPKAGEYFMVITYGCHPFWQSQSKIGTFRLGE